MTTNMFSGIEEDSLQRAFRKGALEIMCQMKQNKITLDEWLKEEVMTLAYFREHWLKKQKEAGAEGLYPGELRCGDWDAQRDLFSDTHDLGKVEIPPFYFSFK